MNKTGATAVPNSLTIFNGGTVQLQQPEQIAETAAVTVDGTLNLGRYNETIDTLAGSGLVTTFTQPSVPIPVLTVGANNGSSTFSGAISGFVGLTKAGSGTLTLSGTTANTYSLGTTTVNGGTLELNKTGVLAVPGNLVIADSATVRLLQANQIIGTAQVELTGGGRLDLNGHSEIVGWLSSPSNTSSVTLGSAAGTVLTVGSASASAEFSGSISGTGDVSVAGINFSLEMERHHVQHLRRRDHHQRRQYPAAKQDQRHRGPG